jgi:hypothetical protein
MQAAGENLNTWGAPKLNTVIALIDFAIAGWTSVALTGNAVLSSANFAPDQARSAMLRFTGAGGCTVTLPSVSKRYDVVNATAGTLTLTTGAGQAAVLGPGDAGPVLCDGVNVLGAQIAGRTLKAYVDAQAWAAQAGNLPGQEGAAGLPLVTDGQVPRWAPLSASAISDFDRAAAQAALGLSLAMAAAL